jgi:hypothetical protein
VNRKELQAPASMRLAEAQALLKTSHADGAYYLAGYAVGLHREADATLRFSRPEDH